MITVPWGIVIRLGDVWKNPDLSFEARRDALVARIRHSRWLIESEMRGVLGNLLDCLADADDPDEWDGYWDQLYDLADQDRVWIDVW